MLELSGLPLKVFNDRYALKDGEGKQIERAPEEMWRRVAHFIAGGEKTEETKNFWEEKFYNALEDFKFVPGGRILSGAGTSAQLTFYNCFVIPSPEDSRGGIFDSVKLMVEIMSRGGGVGVNISTLRPKGNYVKGVNGTASGSVSFGGLYSYATGLITQGGSRRGALMLMLNDDHPDIEDFITVKRTMGLITNANLSVCVSDPFMEAVKEDRDWELKWGGKVHKTVKARELWDKICESAWASGEPGVVFTDRYNKQSNTWYYEKIICVNPCVAGDTRVATADGLKTIKELFESQSKVSVVLDSRLSGERFSAVEKIIQSGVKKVYKLETKEGYEIKLTYDHRVRTDQGWVEAGHLKNGDKIFLSNNGGGFGKEGDAEWGRVLGWFVGDGHFNESKDLAVLSFFGEEKRELAPVFANFVNRAINQSATVAERSGRVYTVSACLLTNRDEARVSSERLTALLFDAGLAIGEKLKVPKSVWEGSADMQRGFLQGLFTADGHVAGTIQKGVSARLSSVSVSLLKEVQQLLLNFKIVSSIYTERRSEGVRELPNGKGGLAPYFCQAQHDLVISQDMVAVFAEQIGFLSEAKQTKLNDLLQGYRRGPYEKQFLATFKNLEYLGEEMVYDLVEPSSHSFSANGLVVHNCGEQGLGAWGVCNLGAVNLAKFERDGRLDYAALGATVRTATRFLDNVIDATYYIFEENRTAQMQTRRVGLGTMGLADLLIKLKIRYGGKEALDLCEELYRFIRDESYAASIEIAAEKGAFPRFDAEKYLEGWFIKRLPENLREEIRNKGIRNAVLLTQAPTGTTSILAEASSGIEPIYDFVLTRKDRLGEHEVYHALYEEFKTKYSNEKLPEYFITAKQLTPEEHIRMQAAIQKYVDSSISKTVNAPKTHTIEQVKELYALAYELGCKGATYFRDGSRDDAVLTSKEDVKKSEAEAKTLEASAAKQEASPPPYVFSPKPRPEIVSGSTYKVKTGYGTLFVTVNNDEEGNPFEVFATIGKTGGFFAAKSEAICRLISLGLRSSIPAETIIDQIKGIRGPMPSWGKYGQILSIPDAIAHVMLEHIQKPQAKLNLEFREQGMAGTINPVKNLISNGINPETLPAASAEPMLAAQITGLHVPERDYVLAETPLRTSSIANVGHAPECPECGGMLVFKESCMLCPVCGYSKCG